MFLAALAIHILEFTFCLGMAGASIVVVLTFYEDGKELFSPEEHAPHKEVH